MSERQRHRQRQTDKDREIHRQRQCQRDRDTDRDRQTKTERYTGRDSVRETETQTETDRWRKEGRDGDSMELFGVNARFIHIMKQQTLDIENNDKQTVRTRTLTWKRTHLLLSCGRTGLTGS